MAHPPKSSPHRLLEVAGTCTCTCTSNVLLHLHYTLEVGTFKGPSSWQRVHLHNTRVYNPPALPADLLDHAWLVSDDPAAW